MTDVDRLRAAADRLDTYAEFAHRASQDRVTATVEVIGAALLRAVAARHVSDSDGERCYGCREPWPCPEAAAAEALADVILGDNDD